MRYEYKQVRLKASPSYGKDRKTELCFASLELHLNKFSTKVLLGSEVDTLKNTLVFEKH